MNDQAANNIFLSFLRISNVYTFKITIQFSCYVKAGHLFTDCGLVTPDIVSRLFVSISHEIISYCWCCCCWDCLFWRHLVVCIHCIKMTSSNGNVFRVTGPLCGEFTGPGEVPAQRPVTRSFDVFFDLRPNKRLSNQPWGWWFKTLSWSLWRHCNVLTLW